MAFESLTDRLAGVFKKLRGHGKLTVKKESALYSRQGCAGYRRLFPGHGGLYAYAIQLQKGDHRNGYF